jgi:N-acetylglucosamine malate deacetylase 2
LAEALRLGGLEHVSRECLGYSDQGVSLRLVQLTHDILSRMESYAPEVVFTHPYEGGHPDHDACAFAVHHAASLYAQDGGTMPLTIEAAFYHLGPHGIQTNEFLSSHQSPECADYALSEEERQRKQGLLACFRTQRETLSYFHIDVERFRVAPNYDFANPPHNPPVFYDHYAWGTSSAQFCELAQQAALGIQREKAGSCL